LITVVGRIDLSRRYCACRHCGTSRVPFDEWAGQEKGHVSARAKRIVCLAASSWSFDQASKNLLEMTGIDVSDQTIRRIAEIEGAKAHAWLASSSLAVADVKLAKGNAEFLTDGTIVNTREGWKEVRLTVACKRPTGEGRDPAAFTVLESRGLPPPTSRLVLVDKLSSEGMGIAWKGLSARLGWGTGEGVSAISDGAKWIATQVGDVWPKAERVVDVYHVSQHLHACGQALHGEGTPAAREWAADQLRSLVREGAVVALWSLERQSESQPDERKKAALRQLLGYLRHNVQAMRYGDRIRLGMPIGSGQIEGACKTVVGRRLKLNSARWLPSNVEPIASLCGLQYSNLWQTYWQARAA